MRRVWLLALVLLAGLPPRSSAYSVLTHEAVVDSLWLDTITPLLLRRFPNASTEDLRKAHAFSYGGAIVQDMGYYPFGSKFFSDLTHYVRSGDFVRTLVRESRDLHEYAFALGAVAHYASDNLGHPMAVNLAVAIEFPKLRRKYGDSIPYAADPVAHMKVEFGFDVTQVAKHRYAPQAYHDLIGFEVARELLERAFLDTYGLEMKDVFRFEDLAIGTFRHAVSHTIPLATRIAWQMSKKEIQRSQPGITRRQFVFTVSHRSYRQEWGRNYRESGPSLGVRVLAFLFRLVPKIGPLKGLEFRPPTAETERLFMASVSSTVKTYQEIVHSPARDLHSLSNRDFDTGKPTAVGEYALADEAYAKLVRTLAEKDFQHTTRALQQNILRYLDHPVTAPDRLRIKESERQDTVRAMTKLRSLSLAAAGDGPAAPGVLLP